MPKGKLKRSKEYKIYNWDMWKIFCEKYDEDPYENDELSFDIGGGDFETYNFTGIIPEKEGL